MMRPCLTRSAEVGPRSGPLRTSAIARSASRMASSGANMRVSACANPSCRWRWPDDRHRCAYGRGRRLVLRGRGMAYLRDKSPMPQRAGNTSGASNGQSDITGKAAAAMIADPSAPRDQSRDEYRELPHDLESERAVLGSLLIERDAIFNVAPLLKPSDFYDARHRTLYAAILALFHAHKPTDMVTLNSELERTRTLETAGGIGYIAELLREPITAVYALAYAGNVKNKARRRAILAATLATVKDAYDETIDVPELGTRALAGRSDAVDGH